MPKRKFKATEGLLNDTMRKQSGVIEKALLEATMNAVDANASEVNITIDEDRVVIKDDGDGISEERVEKYFEQFGKKDDDIEDKEFGKFRMGRGQIFNFGVNIWRSRDNIMVVSLDDSEVTLELDTTTTEEDQSVAEVDGDEYTLDTAGLSYAWLKSDEEVSGTEIEIVLYNPIQDVDNTVSEFKKLTKYISWLHDTKVVVNDDEVYEEPEVIHETELAYYASHAGGIGSRSNVYNKGALVDDFSLGRVQMSIITKADLDVTLDRTDILNTDENWKAIQEEYTDLAIDILLEKDEPDKREQRWLLELMADDLMLVEDLKNVPVVKDIHGNSWTIESISGHDISFAQKDDKVAEEAMRQSDTVMVEQTYKSEFRQFTEAATDLFSHSEMKEYSDVVESDMKWEMNEVKDDDLSKKRKTNLDQIRGFIRDLGFRNEVKAGHSKHQDVWKDDEGTLFIDKDFVNAKKSVLHTTVAFEVVRVASYDGDTRGGIEDNITSRREFKKYMEGEQIYADCDYPTAQQRLMAGHYE